MTRTHTALAALSSLALAACGPRPPAPVTGLIDATEIDVASKIPGRIKVLAVREGDRVEAGRELANIESQEVAAKIEQVRAAVSAARAKLTLARNGARAEEKEQARHALDTAQAQVAVAQKAYDRASALLKTETITQATFDDAEFKYKAAQDQVAATKARYDLVVKGARAEEIEALQALVRQGEGSLAEVESYGRETVQVAPIGGEVAKVLVHRGELAATGFPILTLVDRSDSWAAFPIREDLLPEVKVGATLQVEVPALRRKLPMRVFSVSPMGDFATWRSTSEKGSFDLRTFEVRARPENPDPDLRPGMTARFIPRSAS
ncbi:MAG TPA: efflux RND transporter periplasmic adaptor subunit [Anaeromyxobacter sp.]|nr:efflux RND transporter periplasmic adaptor subunit [Anaeromyxobacter sp.]